MIILFLVCEAPIAELEIQSNAHLMKEASTLATSHHWPKLYLRVGYSQAL